MVTTSPPPPRKQASCYLEIKQEGLHILSVEGMYSLKAVVAF